MATRSDLGEWVRARRDARGLSRQALADAAGVPVTRVAKWEAGEAVPDLRQAARLFRALGTDDAGVLQLLKNLCD